MVFLTADRRHQLPPLCPCLRQTLSPATSGMAIAGISCKPERWQAYNYASSVTDNPMTTTPPKEPFHALGRDAALERIAYSSVGLSSEEAARRLQQHGANRLPEPPRRSSPLPIWRRSRVSSARRMCRCWMDF